MEGNITKKRNILLHAALIMLTLIAIMSSVNVHAASKKNWYKKVLNSTSGTYTIKGKTYKRKDFKYYKLLDINGDGTKELILSKHPKSLHIGQYKNNTMILLTYHNKKIVPLKAWNTYGCKECLIYKKNLKMVCFFPGLGTYETIPVYTVKKGKLKVVHKFYERWNESKKRMIMVFDGKEYRDSDKFSNITGKYLDYGHTVNFKKIK